MQCLSVESATATRGDQLLLLEDEKARDLHWDGTGLEGLDEVLHGFSGTGMIELTGKTDVGKTVCQNSGDRPGIPDDFVAFSSYRYMLCYDTYHWILQ